LYTILSNEFDILIISTLHDEYKNSNIFIDEILKKDAMLILDTVGLFSQSEIDKLLTKHNLKVLGRGDL
jgi:UDP-N-acetyl-D-mannosaminuronate dehydrogenase